MRADFVISAFKRARIRSQGIRYYEGTAKCHHESMRTTPKPHIPKPTIYSNLDVPPSASLLFLSSAFAFNAICLFRSP